jgi:hypothetical protein
LNSDRACQRIEHATGDVGDSRAVSRQTSRTRVDGRIVGPGPYAPAALENVPPVPGENATKVLPANAASAAEVEWALRDHEQRAIGHDVRLCVR